jgi:hypothetical protein
LLQNTLAILPDSNWWHIISGRSTSFVFLHDINEPRLLALDTAETFIKVGDLDICSETSYCTLKSDKFIVSENEEDHGMFKHLESGTHLIQYFTQKINENDAFNQRGIQEAQRMFLNEYIFKTIENVSMDMMNYLTNILPGDWFSFQQENKTFVWCYYPDENALTIEIIEEKINALGFQIFTVEENAKKKIIENIDMIQADFITHDHVDQLTFPVDLKNRLFWLAKSFLFGQKGNLELIEKLIQYKFSYEYKWGFSNELKRKQINYPALTYALHELNKVRGQRMLDINIWHDPIWIVMRFRERKIQSSDELAIAAIEEFEKVYADIKAIFVGN